MDDHELLRNYVQSRSEESFGELLNRHLPMVYSAAQRMVCDAHLAEEVAQNVFTALSQKGSSLRPPQVIGGWLYNTTRHFALHAIRTEQRRREREQTAADMQSLNADAEPNRILEQLEPVMGELAEKDRDILVLRFLENRTLKQVGAELGINEDAARMRVNRALEELRALFGRQGIGVTSVVLGTVLGASSATAIPVGLAATIATTTFAGAITVTHLVTMSWINAKTVAAILSAALLAGTGTYLVQQGKIKQLVTQNDAALAQQRKLNDDYQASLKNAQIRDRELERLQKNARELLQLRNEVGQLRKEQNAQKQVAPKKDVSVPAPRVNDIAAFPPGTYITKEQLVFAVMKRLKRLYSRSRLP